MQKNGAESFGISQVPPLNTRRSRVFSSVTAHSSITGGRKLLYPFQYFQHTPQTHHFCHCEEEERRRGNLTMSVAKLWRVLKIPSQSIFFPPSIPLFFPPLLQFRHLRKIYASWQFRNAPFFCEVFTPFCRRFPTFLHPKHGRAVFSVPSPRTGA